MICAEKDHTWGHINHQRNLNNLINSFGIEIE